MLQFDKTQPIRHNAPRLDFGRGVYMVHILGDMFALVSQSGIHLDFIIAEEIEYAPTLAEQFIQSRSIKSD